MARIERGQIDPRASTLNRLLRACGLELSVHRAGIDEHGIDRTLIRSQLAKTPTERIQAAVNAARLADAVGTARGTGTP